MQRNNDDNNDNDSQQANKKKKKKNAKKQTNTHKGVLQIPLNELESGKICGLV